MNLQYILDRTGHTTAVQIPIEDWEKMKQTFKGLEDAVNEDLYVISERQKELVNVERQKAKDDPNYMQDWEDVLKRLDPDAC